MDKIAETEKSYLACFIDTDGTLTMRTRYLKNGRMWFEIRMIFFNCESKDILLKLKEFTGVGCVTVALRYAKNSTEYKYVVNSFEDVEELLTEIYPYMNLTRKKKIAMLLLEVCQIRREVRTTQHPYHKGGERYKYPPRLFEIQKEITELNAK